MTSGVLIIDKPAGMTSHDVVQKVRRVYGTKKVGHAGTLDPEVTGVLVLCIGEATRLLEYLTSDVKAYRGQVTFGTSTDTDDASGNVLAVGPTEHLSEQLVRAAADAFVGDIEQKVPAFSAVHINGRRAYDLAREGVHFELPVRTVSIHALMVNKVVRDVQGGLHIWTADFEVTCSKGTYVRALCRDWGERLSIPAHMSDLRRIQSGKFTEDEAVPLHVVVDSSCPEQFLLPIHAALRDLYQFVVSERMADLLAFGQSVTVSLSEENRTTQGAVDRDGADGRSMPTIGAAVTRDGVLVAIVTCNSGLGSYRLIPKKVFWKVGTGHASH